MSDKPHAGRPLSIEELRKKNAELGEPKTLQWAAKQLLVSVWTVRRYIEGGKLQGYNPNGGTKGLRVWERSVYELKLNTNVTGIAAGDTGGVPVEEEPEEPRPKKQPKGKPAKVRKRGFATNW